VRGSIGGDSDNLIRSCGNFDAFTPDQVCMKQPHARPARVSLRAAIGTVATGSATLLWAGAAWAHIDATPAAVQAGSTTTISFGLEHGCSGSPTIGLRFQIPAGVTNVKPVDKVGWTPTVTATEVSFAGGKLDAETPADFAFTMTAPLSAATIYFPVIQKCALGQIDWITIPTDGLSEPERPAPAVVVTGGNPTSEDLTPEERTVDDATTSVAITSTTVAASGSSGTDITTNSDVTTAPSPDTSASAGAGSPDGGGSGGNGALIGGLIGAGVVAAGGAAVWVRKRRSI
jgi:periplasmic copper chaperone A